MTEIRRRPETQAFLETIIDHPKLEDAIAVVLAAHATTGFKAKGAIIVGESGVGKSTLADAYLKLHPRTEEPDRTRIPVLVVETHGAQTTKAITAELLHALDVPFPNRATASDLFVIMKRAFRTLGVEVLLFDEFQEALPNRTKDAPNIMRFIKRAMNETQIPWVLLGTKELTRIFDTNDNQLKRRFNGIHVMEPYSIHSDEEFEDFRAYIQVIQSALPMPCRSLTDDNMLLRLYCSTGGVPGLIANLFEKLIESFENETVLLTDLATAHRLAFIGSGQVRTGSRMSVNPFVASIASLKQKLGMGL